MAKVFIDGSAGTTGLRIYERLGERKDIELIILNDAVRKDINARKEAINSCDIAFLCLPDVAAIEAVSLIENDNTAVIDTSTAHRTSLGWVYGFPELSGKREQIKSSKRIANPGCHASGFIALVYPLVEKGVLDPDVLLACHSLTGYSGGGNKMIGEYESEGRSALLDAPRQYGLSQEHKHLKEMKAISGIDKAPLFCPIVADFYSGMLVTVPIFASDLNGSIEDIKQIYSSTYRSSIVSYVEDMSEEGFASAAALSGKDSMQIGVFGNSERMILVARYDNLGKGASGAAVECLNIKLNNEWSYKLEI